jgi:ABC-2 type transport system ATP-binding protein
VLFLDEPTTGLDPVSRNGMWTTTADLVRQGTTVVLTTQYLEEADRLADRVVLVDRGRVSAEGTADELKARVGGERLVLAVDDVATARAAARVLGSRTTGSGDGGRPSVTVRSDGSADSVRRVLDDLHRAAIPVRRVDTVRPSLDDVFLALTGSRPAEPPAEPLVDEPAAVPA